MDDVGSCLYVLLSTGMNLASVSSYPDDAKKRVRRDMEMVEGPKFGSGPVLVRGTWTDNYLAKDDQELMKVDSHCVEHSSAQ